MNQLTKTPWGKLARSPTGSVQEWHSLVDHSADVAACFEALIATPIIAARLARLAGCDVLPDVWIWRLATCVFLHDLGKANVGFQARWNADAPFVGHMRPALALLTEASDLAERPLPIAAIEHWGAEVGDAVDAV